MSTILLLAVAVALYYYLFKQAKEEKERKQRLLKEKEEREQREREEKERERQELKRLSELRSATSGTKRIISKTRFVGKCPSCGASIKNASLFCMYCGTDLSGNVQEHIEYIDTRTPLEKKIDIEYEERMEKVKRVKQERWLTILLAIVFIAVIYVILRPIIFFFI